LRRVLPAGAAVLVGFWCNGRNEAGLKALEAMAEADAYATTLKEAARFCIDAARGHEPAKTNAPAREGAQGRQGASGEGRETGEGREGRSPRRLSSAYRFGASDAATKRA
jgi:hypothetical protein